jgi:hypothetical protein
MVNYDDLSILGLSEDYGSMAYSIKACCVSKFNKLILLDNPLDLSEILSDKLQKNIVL